MEACDIENAATEKLRIVLIETFEDFWTIGG